MGRQARGTPTHPTAALALVAVTAVWGATFPLVQRGIAEIPTFHFLFVRFALATVLLGPVAYRSSGLRGLVVSRAILPGLLLAAGFSLQTEGLRSVSPSISAFLTGTSVVLVPLVCALLGWEKQTLRLWISIFLAFGGIFLLQGMRVPSHWARGETLTLLCAVAFAGQIVLTGHYARSIPPEAFTGTQMLVATVVLAALAGHGGALGSATDWGRDAIVAASFTGIFATAGAFFVQTWAQRKLSPAQVAVIFSTEPLFAAIVSMGLYGDTLTVAGWLGGGAILAGTILATIQPSGSAGRRSPGP